MPRSLSNTRLRRENLAFRNTGGISAGNHSAGFVPAFCDTRTGDAQPARFADGRQAPCHVLDGVRPDWVATRGANGQVLRLKRWIIAGFLRDGLFYTREQARLAVNQAAGLPH